MVVLLLSLHSNEMSLQEVQNVAKLNSWEQTAFSVTAAWWHGLIWGEIPSYCQEDSPLLLCRGCCINGLWIPTAWAFCGEFNRFGSMLGLSFLTNLIFFSLWNPLQSRAKQPSVLRQPGPAASWEWVRGHCTSPLPELMWEKGKQQQLQPKSQLLPKLSPVCHSPYLCWVQQLLSVIISLNRWIQSNHNALLENWSPESKKDR